MSDGMAPDWRLLSGADGPPPERTRLRAGPLTVDFDPDLAAVCRVHIGEREVLRGIYATVRDQDWGTVPARVTGLCVDCRPDWFTVTFEVECRQAEIDFVWHGSLTGDARGTVRFTMEGEARSSFRRSRIGFCVLHPADAAGEPVTVEHPDGSTDDTSFPKAISPYQPFRQVRAFHQPLEPGVTLEVRMEGEVWETEDQRNWTDASYKTYCTPLDLPFPVPVAPGDRVSQSVTVTLHGATAESAPDAGAGRSIALAVPAEAARRPLPRLGLGFPADQPALSEAQAALLRPLRLSHLRVDLHRTDPSDRPTLEGVLDAARAVSAGLEVGLFLPPDVDPELRWLAEHPGLRQLPSLDWLVYRAGAHATTEREVRLARRSLPFGRIGGGTNVYFTELNRSGLPADDLDFVCFSINPQCHAFDDATLVENLAAQATVVDGARRLYPGKPVHVTPVTLRPRFHPHLFIGGAPPDANSADPRQASLFAAAWTLGSFKYLSEAGADSVTYFETAGTRGVLPSAASASETTAAGEPVAYPVYLVLRELALAGVEVVPSRSSDPLSTEVLALRRGGERFFLIANLTGRAVQSRLVVPGLGGSIWQWRVDPQNLSSALHSPELFDRTWGSPASVTENEVSVDLPPYAIVRLDSGTRPGEGAP